MEFSIALLVLAVLALGAVAIIGLTVQADRLRMLTARLERLETALGRKTTRAPAPIIVTTVHEDVIMAEVVDVEPAPPPPPPPPAEADAASVEAWIGRRGLGWLAVVLLLFAAAFFLKQVFENRWIGEAGRVALGVLAGVALCFAGLRYHRRRWRIFSQMLTAAGIVLLYLSTFGAFGYYHLLPRPPAGVFLTILVVESALLALSYESPAIANMAVIGALLAPLLLHTDRDQYRSLFLYLTGVDAGVIWLLLLRPWPAVGSLGLLGTQLLFWTWHAENFHPEKLAAALAFQAVVFALFLLYSAAAHLWRRRPASWEDLARLVVNAAFFFLALYQLLDADYHAWMACFALGTGLLYTLLAWLVLSGPQADPRQSLVAAAVALGFVAVAIPLQLDGVWISLGWALQGTVLWCFGLRVRAGLLRAGGTALLYAAAVRLLLIETPIAHPAPFLPLWNTYALPALVVGLCFLAAARAGARFRPRLSDFDKIAVYLAGLVGLALVWLVLSVETYDYYAVRIKPARPPSTATVGTTTVGQPLVDVTGRPMADVQAEETAHLQHMAQMVLSVVWTLYAAVVLAAGFRLRNLGVRWAALVIFAATLGKVLLVDMADLPGFYRAATFFALAVTMGVAAWAYQQRQGKQPDHGHEGLQNGTW